MGDTIEWHRYNSTLVDRGKLTFWIPEDLQDLEADWYCKEGSQHLYSDRAIEVLSTIRFKFGLTLRELEGFAKSLFSLLGLDLQIPCYSTLCRRLEGLNLIFWQQIDPSSDLNVVVDSTGLKVFGEGEWKVRIHGYTKRRTWRKLHLAVDESNNQILAVALTTNAFKDNEVLPSLMKQIDPDRIKKVIGDGAYDDKKCFEWAENAGVQGIFPPKKGAKIAQHGNSDEAPKLRDRLIRGIRQFGRAEWKKRVGYHRRSIVETAMFRFKTLLGDRLQSRKFSSQWSEVVIKLNILNKMKTPRTCS